MKWLGRSIGVLAIAGLALVWEPAAGLGSPAGPVAAEMMATAPVAAEMMAAAPAAVSAAANATPCQFCHVEEWAAYNEYYDRYEYVLHAQCELVYDNRGALGCVGPSWQFDQEGNWLGAKCIMWSEGPPNCVCDKALGSDGPFDAYYANPPDCEIDSQSSELSFDGTVASARTVAAGIAETTVVSETACTGVVVERQLSPAVSARVTLELQQIVI